jgi:hypothetical protein
MQALRSSKLIASLVLVWFALFVGSAIAAAFVNPGQLQMVCSGDGGMKMVDSGDDGGEIKLSSRMDCPLCACVGAPPSPGAGVFHITSPLAHVLQPVAAAHIASVTAPPLPSRGPPLARLS